MLNMVLLDNISSDSKVKTLSEEFEVETTPHLEKGVAEMCNLSEGIEKRGKAEEHASLTIKYLQTLMRKSGLTADAAMDMLDIPAADRPRYAEIIKKEIH